LQRRASEQPDHTALRFLGERSEDDARIDYAGLDRQSRALAVQLMARGATGKRVLVLHVPGLERTICAFGA
jgi:acyl-CoA synthetase (AMP-forming)/AMP-acid ligase II